MTLTTALFSDPDERGHYPDSFIAMAISQKKSPSGGAFVIARMKSMKIRKKRGLYEGETLTQIAQGVSPCLAFNAQAAAIYDRVKP